MAQTPLVSTGWLDSHLDDPEIRIVDCRWYLRPFDEREGDVEYRRSHIPGAVHLRWDTDIADPAYPAMGLLADPQRYALAMAARGIGDDTLVVAYDDQHVTVAARVWWSLRVYGHSDVAVLDGGFSKWCSEGRAVDTLIPAFPPATFTPRRNDHLYATKDDVLAATNSAVQLVDGRMHGARVEDGGEIPGSVTLPGIEFIGADGTWVGPTEARRRIDATGAARHGSTIAYCRGGVGACGTALAYAIADAYDIAVYDGSWSEWAADPTTPKVVDS